MYLMIILQVTKNQGFSVCLEDTIFEKPQGGRGSPSCFRVNKKLHFLLIVNNDNCKWMDDIFWVFLTRLWLQSKISICLLDPVHRYWWKSNAKFSQFSAFLTKCLAYKILTLKVLILLAWNFGKGMNIIKENC